MIGVAPGPANGFTLDVIGCFERFGALIDWAMLILGPLEPWPGELALGAAAAAGVQVIARVVDYGGLFHDDVVAGHEFARADHRSFRPAGWVAAGPRADRADAPDRRAPRAHPAAARVRVGSRPARRACVAPTLIQESGAGARAIEDKRAELAALPESRRPLTPRRSRRDPRARRQLRLYGAQGRGSRPRRRGARRPLAAARRAPRGSWPRAGRSTPRAISPRPPERTVRADRPGRPAEQTARANRPERTPPQP